jgi:WhiB family redox-sensing transcriptional regulator
VFALRDLPEPLTDPLSATPDAVLPCWSEDPDLFFAESPADVEAAKALCVACPLRARCLAEALDRREPWGVWGGELVVQGVVVPRKRPRGRPRKDDPYGIKAAASSAA